MGKSETGVSIMWWVMTQCCTEKVTDSCWCLRDRWWPIVVFRKSQTAVDICVTGDEPVLYWESHRQLLMFAWQVTNQCCIEKVTQLSVFAWSVMTQCYLEKVRDSCQCWCDRWQPGVVLKKSETAVSICMTGDDSVLYWESHSQLSVFPWWVMTWCHLEKVRQLWGFAWQVTTQCCLETVGGRRVSSKGEEHWPVMQGVSSGVLGQAQTWPTGRARHRCVHPPLFTLQLLLPVEKKMFQISPGSNFCAHQSFQHFSQAKYHRAIHAFKFGFIQLRLKNTEKWAETQKPF